MSIVRKSLRKKCILDKMYYYYYHYYVLLITSSLTINEEKNFRWSSSMQRFNSNSSETSQSKEETEDFFLFCFHFQFRSFFQMEHFFLLEFRWNLSSFVCRSRGCCWRHHVRPVYQLALRSRNGTHKKCRQKKCRHFKTPTNTHTKKYIDLFQKKLWKKPTKHILFFSITHPFLLFVLNRLALFFFLK